MTLQVIGAGFGRTGTESMKMALETIGFDPCHHMTEVLGNPAQVKIWRAAARGDLPDWDVAFAGYRATVDWPGCAFYKELMEIYPDAKVLLSVRDPEKWYASASATIFKGTPLTIRLLAPVMRLFSPRMAHVSRVMTMAKKLILEDTFHNRLRDKDFMIECFNRHNQEVEAHVPADRLLVYQVTEGWEPLCAFLDVPVPDKPFPRTNKREDFAAMLQKLMKE